MNLRLLLLPFTAIYASIMTIRNWLYDKHFLRQTAFGKPVICVGNITVGGTGKTPFAEFLLKHLDGHRVGIASRGYGRKTRGLVVGDSRSTAAQIGDEPFQMMQKFHVPVVVAEDRSAAINHLIDSEKVDVVVMDDGFQHRSSKPSMSIVMADYARPMWHDWTFPAGNMREPWRGYKRADIVVVNKCPLDMSVDERNSIAKHFAPHTQLFFAGIGYGHLRNENGDVESEYPQKAVVVAGIGRPQPFFDEIAQHCSNVKTMTFADHHAFDEGDIDAMIAAAEVLGGADIVMTEKDFSRLAARPMLKERLTTSDFVAKTLYLPIELKILFDGHEALTKKIYNHVRTHSSNQ